MKPAPLTNDEWHWRWLQRVRGRSVSLHRTAAPFKTPDRDDPNWPIVKVRTVCGMPKERFAMPGMFSRMGAPRCRKCCKTLGLTFGYGSPYNSKKLRKELREL